MKNLFPVLWTTSNCTEQPELCRCTIRRYSLTHSLTPTTNRNPIHISQKSIYHFLTNLHKKDTDRKKPIPSKSYPPTLPLIRSNKCAYLSRVLCNKRQISRIVSSSILQSKPSSIDPIASYRSSADSMSSSYPETTPEKQWQFLYTYCNKTPSELTIIIISYIRLFRRCQTQLIENTTIKRKETEQWWTVSGGHTSGGYCTAFWTITGTVQQF